MKKIFAKQHNILFAAACVIFAQFISAIIFAYLQVIGGLASIINMTFYFYMAYCVAACVFCAAFIIIKKPGLAYAKLWLSGLFLYMFCEVLFFAKLFVTAYRDIPGFSLWEPNFGRAVTTYTLQDAHPFFRLFLSFALIFTAYIFMYIHEKKRGCLKLAAFNLVLVSAVVILAPVSHYIASDYALDILAFAAAREAALIIIFLNLLTHAFYIWYKE